MLRMDDWRVNVRSEDALARGSLQEDTLEFFLKVLRHVARVLVVTRFCRLMPDPSATFSFWSGLESRSCTTCRMTVAPFSHVPDERL